MKKLVILIAIITLGLSANAENTLIPEEIIESPQIEEQQNSEITLEAKAIFDWVDISQVERDKQIQEYKNILFNSDIKKIKKKDFRQKYSDFLKDKNWKEHYRLAKLGVLETEGVRICAFFFKKDILLIYALQYKNNPQRVYYYNAYGSLQYVDEISDNYPNFPYNSKQYKKNGKLVSAIYFTSHDTQYMYGPDGEFTGLWHKNKMFDKNGKQKITRTNW